MMRSSNGKAQFGAGLLKGGVSALALTAMAAALAVPAYAQDAAQNTAASSDSSKATEVVVVGVRRSLKTAQQIKRNADTVVDSITATDIGSFPDKSVAEALQRVAGVTVNRFAASSDTAHFSAEPSGVLVRGLTFVRSEFNGRDTFSANSSRGLSWGDVSPELMAGVDTYKNQTADLIEGGIAGSINLRTRVPFDSKGQLVAISADASYGDISKKWEPDVSGIYSNRWDTKLGEFGLMVNAAYSHVLTGSQGIQYDRMGIFCDDLDPDNDPSTCTSNQFGTTDSDAQHNFAYIPSGVAYRDNTYDRVRKGVAFAVQWQPHDHSMLATFQYNKSSYQNQMHEHVVHATFFSLFGLPLGYQVSDSATAAPLPGQNFTFDDNGQFTSGTLTNSLGWFGADNAASAQVAANDQGVQMINACYGWNGCNPVRYGAGLATATRYSNNLEDTQDMSFNFKWDINDKLHTNFDVQYVLAHVTNYDIEVDLNSLADVTLNAPDGAYPSMSLVDGGTNVNQSAGGLANPDNYYYNAVMDHSENSRGFEGAARFDVEYDFDNGGWLNSLRAGVRWADRNQHVNWSNYNWKNLANLYSNNAAFFNADSPVYPSGLTETDAFGANLMHGNHFLNDSQYVFFNMNTLESQQALADALSTRALMARNPTLFSSGGVPGGDLAWVPLCERPADVAGSCYTPAEIMNIDETTEAAYLMLKFGGNDKTIFGKTVDGNIGVRYVETIDESLGGGVKYPDAFQYTENNCNGSLTATQLAQAGSNGQYQVTTACVGNHSVADQAFADGSIHGTGPFPADAKSTHINWLPSFNLKVNLSDTWLTRFAYSRALSRPDMGYLRNYFYITRDPLTSSELVPGNPQLVYPVAGSQDPATNCAVTTTPGVGTNPCSYLYTYTGSSGNPYLKPMTADQFDLTFENYFSSVGSFSFDIFYKKFYNYIVNGQRQSVSLTNGTVQAFDTNGQPILDGNGNPTYVGVTRNVILSGPINAPGASIKGFEVAYQRFFDFLPGLWSGLGIQTNYTHVVNTGIRNVGLGSTTANGLAQGGDGVNSEYDNIDPHALEGLSKDAYNVVAMYEKGPWALRAAYNWRSKYLVTAADCCVGFPIWQKASGFLDASIRYQVNNNIELSIQGSNLLNTDTVLLQQVDNRGTLTPNAWFQNDRRIQLGVRLKY